MNIDYNAIASIIGLVTALIAVTALGIESRRSRLTLQTDMLLRLDEKFYGTEMRRVRQRAANNLIEGISPNYELEDLLDYFTTVGMLLERRAINLEMTYELYEYWITRFWHCSKNYIMEQREKNENPDAWLVLERLVNDIDVHRKRKGLKEISEDGLKRFLKSEASIRHE